MTDPNAYNHIESGNEANSSTVQEGATPSVDADNSSDDSGGPVAIIRHRDGSRSRVRISKKNPEFGMVEGAMRGNNRFGKCEPFMCTGKLNNSQKL